MAEGGTLHRFESKFTPEPNTGCWLWHGNIAHTGYGSLTVRRRPYLAHRMSFELYRGEITPGLQIDHLCRVRSCVNPDHFELVTIRENVLRGEGITARNKRKTECPLGHAYAGENLRTTKEGFRQCKLCQLNRERSRSQEQKDRKNFTRRIWRAARRQAGLSHG